MPIPKYTEIFFPILELLKHRGELLKKDFETPLAQDFNLTQEELSAIHESGNARIFYNRIGWALSYLNMAGLVTKPKRGYYKITQEGINILNTPDKLEEYIAKKIQQRNQEKSHITIQPTFNSINESDDGRTPQEIIQTEFQKIKEGIYDEILKTIISKKPREFEKLVVALLQKMGYGGEIEDASQVTKYTNDEGIDGIIKEDVLGFERIYIQAKRHRQENKIGREDLNKFVGALAVTESKKGVFITTSSFNNNAIEYANKLNNNVTLILIDGKQLAKYIYDYSLGMQAEQIIEIKKLDGDFWDDMEDENA